MKVLYLDHEAVIFFRDCADGCSRPDAHVQNCTISKIVRVLRQAGVICGELGI